MNIVRLALAGMFACLGVLFALAFYFRYWLWRDCFNELGRCYDPVSQDVFLEQSGAVWGSFAAVTLMLAVFLLRAAIRSRP